MTADQLALTSEPTASDRSTASVPAPRAPEAEPEHPTDVWRISGQRVDVHNPDQDRER